MCDLLSQSKLGSNHMQFSFFVENIHTNTMYRYLNKNICINAKHLTCHLMTLVEVFHMTDDCMSEFLNTLYVQNIHVQMYMTVYRFYTYCILMVLSLNLVIMSLVFSK